jgi:hypothetical protein
VHRSVKEAAEAALDKEQGWSSAGEDSDGGIPVTPVPSVPGSKKGGTGAQIRNNNNGSKSTPKYSEGPWPPTAPSSGDSSQRRNNPWGAGPSSAPAAWDMPKYPLSGAAPSFASQVAKLEDMMLETKFFDSDKNTTTKGYRFSERG